MISLYAWFSNITTTVRRGRGTAAEALGAGLVTAGPLTAGLAGVWLAARWPDRWTPIPAGVLLPTHPATAIPASQSPIVHGFGLTRPRPARRHTPGRLARPCGSQRAGSCGAQGSSSSK